MMRLYTTLLHALRPLASIRAACAGSAPAARREWDERLGRRTPTLDHGAIWIHGASLGEARLVASIAGELRRRAPGRPLAASAFTPAGRAALPVPPAVDAAFFWPLDFPSSCRRVLDAVRPSALALVETELWPTMLHAAAARGIPVVVLNGRLSARRAARYRRLRSLYAPLAGTLHAVAAQSRTDADRFVALGVPAARVGVAGNVKYDLVAAAGVDRGAVDRWFASPPARLLVAGSTAEGEEALVLDALRRCRDHEPGLALVLAPRHLERVERVERLARDRGLRVARRSSGRKADDVLLLDTHGELGALYAAADIAFVGGSMVPVGGHNVLEPAAVGVPVLFGPHTQNVAEPAAALVEAGGAARVADIDSLVEAIVGWLADDRARLAAGRAAARVVDDNRGALTRNVDCVLDAVHAA